jgi:hypothetical protein
MAELTVSQPSITGGVSTPATAASGGDTFANDGRTYLRVTNAHGSAARTITVDAPGTCNFGVTAHAGHDSVSSVAALTTEEIGPFPVDQFSTTCSVTYSDSAANVTVAVIRRP